MSEEFSVCVRGDSREVSQIGNVDVGVNVDVQSHPVGCSPPQILLFLSCSKPNCTLTFQLYLKKVQIEI